MFLNNNREEIMENKKEQEEEQVSYEITADWNRFEELITDLCGQVSAQFIRELKKKVEVVNE
jgi:16S rRNA C1402 (ribose-2'-O) methylase RsmI